MVPLVDFLNAPDVPAAEQSVGGANVRALLYTAGDHRASQGARAGAQGLIEDIGVTGDDEENDEEVIGVQVLATRPIAPGEELLMDYGPLTNSQMLAKYGFFCRGNPHDHYTLRFRERLPSLSALDFFMKMGKDPITKDSWVPKLLAEPGEYTHATRFPTSFHSVFLNLRFLNCNISGSRLSSLHPGK